MMRRTLFAWIAAMLALLAVSDAAVAVKPDEMLKDPALEQRARQISEGLRCLVCQNQSIDDSDAPLARDLRLLVRERLKEGDSNEQVVDYIAGVYGDFVLLKPPFKGETLILWLSPFVLLLLGIWLSRRMIGARQNAVSREAPLTDAEKARLDDVLGKGS